jgi:hypothetical protein
MFQPLPSTHALLVLARSSDRQPDHLTTMTPPYCPTTASASPFPTKLRRCRSSRPPCRRRHSRPPLLRHPSRRRRLRAALRMGGGYCEGVAALLPEASCVANYGADRCSLRLPALLPMSVGVATHGGRRCSPRRPVLLPAAAGVAPCGRRCCSPRSPALLPMASGVAPRGCRCCSPWPPALPLRRPALLPTTADVSPCGRALAVYATRGGRRCYNWWPPVLHGADWRRNDVRSPALLRAVAAGSRDGALVPARGDDAREAGRQSFHGSGDATIC